jgi:hypothetical protein
MKKVFDFWNSIFSQLKRSSFKAKDKNKFSKIKSNIDKEKVILNPLKLTFLNKEMERKFRKGHFDLTLKTL